MATNFLWDTSLTAALKTLLNTELNAVTTGSYATSSGSFSTTDTGAAIWGEIQLTLGAIGTALTAGANICGWFVKKIDGTNFANTSAPPRPPDFIIPLPATTISAGAIYEAAGLVQLPAVPFEVVIQNNTGQTLAGSAANFLKVAPVNMQAV